MSEKYIRILRDGFGSMDMAQNILVTQNSSRNGNGSMCGTGCNEME